MHMLRQGQVARRIMNDTVGVLQNSYKQTITTDTISAKHEQVRLSVNGQEALVSAAADLGPYWQAVRRRQFSEVWLEAGNDGPALAMLVNGERAWLMYLRDREGDLGLSSRNPAYSGPPVALTDPGEVGGDEACVSTPTMV